MKEIIKYFKDNKGYERLFRGIKNKYVSLGEIKGNVIIQNPTQQEKQALSGLMKKDFSKNKTISINLKKLQDRLNETRFSGFMLKDIVQEYFREEIISKKDINKIYLEELNEFFNNILENMKNTFVYEYLKEILESKNRIYHFFKLNFKRNKGELKQAIENACSGINNLPLEYTRLPIFASKITDNPHGFDRNTLSGKIFIMILCYVHNKNKPKTSEELAELYYENCLLIDNVSNMVLCKNIEGIRKKSNGMEHQGLLGFKNYNEPLYLTIYNLSNIENLVKNSKYDKVLVMENPAVFMDVMERCKNKDFPMVCTYGQVKLSGIMLLDLIAKTDATIYYSGDIDPEGLQIADKLKQRYKQKLKFIGFEVDTFKRNISTIKLEDNRLVKLKNIVSPELQETCKILNDTGYVAYEEENIDNLIRFVDTQ